MIQEFPAPFAPYPIPDESPHMRSQLAQQPDMLANPQTVAQDEQTLEAASTYPDRFIPFYAGLNIFDDSCVADMEAGFGRGLMGVGEIVGSNDSQNPDWVWAATQPLDGHLGEVYAACGQYRKPILLHLPPRDTPVMDTFRQALAAYPQTTFIYAHAFGITTPAFLEGLLTDFPNLYLDFYAGFVAFNPRSEHTLAEFVPLLEKYPERVMLSTDSGCEIGYVKAYLALYRMIDLVSPDTREWIAHRTVESMVQP